MPRSELGCIFIHLPFPFHQLLPTKDHQLLSQLEFVEKQDLVVKIVTIGAMNGAAASSNSNDEEV